jgi:hypothetical protein
MMKANPPLFLVIIIALFSFSTKAQEANKKTKKTNITIIREDNGVKTIIDTTFSDADDTEIDEFFNSHGIDKSTPPEPSAPPLPPALKSRPVPPIPPVAPVPPVPSLNNGNKSFYYHFKGDENNAVTDAGQKMEKAKEALQLAHKEVKKSLEVNFNKKEYDRIMEDIEMQLKDIKIELENNEKKKRIIIHKKTSNVDDINDDDMGFTYEPESNQKVIVRTITSGSNENDHIIINESDKGEQNHCYSYTTKHTIVKERSKFRKFLNKVANKILE